MKSSTVLGFAEEDGNAGPMLIAHYEALAKGGVGRLTVESSCVDYPLAGKGQNRLRIDDHGPSGACSARGRRDASAAGRQRRHSAAARFESCARGWPTGHRPRGVPGGRLQRLAPYLASDRRRRARGPHYLMRESRGPTRTELPSMHAQRTRGQSLRMPASLMTFAMRIISDRITAAS